MKKLMKTQSARFVAVLVAAALAVVLVTGAGHLPFLRADVTPQQVMTMDPVAIEAVKALDKDVTIYNLATDDGKDMWVDELVQKYDRMSSHISYEVINPASEKATDLGVTAAENSLVVVSGDRSIVIPAENLYENVYNEMYYY